MTLQKPEPKTSPLKNLLEGFFAGFAVVGSIFGIIGLIVGVALLLSLPTYWLWNWLMPIIFKLPEITWWQALGLNMLSNILFKTSVSKK